MHKDSTLEFDGAVIVSNVGSACKIARESSLQPRRVETRAKADPMLTRDALEKAAALYLGNHDRREPKASPLYGHPYSVMSAKTKFSSTTPAASLKG